MSTTGQSRAERRAAKFGNFSPNRANHQPIELLQGIGRELSEAWFEDLPTDVEATREIWEFTH